MRSLEIRGSSLHPKGPPLNTAVMPGLRAPSCRGWTSAANSPLCHLPPTLCAGANRWLSTQGTVYVQGPHSAGTLLSGNITLPGVAVKMGYQTNGFTLLNRNGFVMARSEFGFEATLWGKLALQLRCGQDGAGGGGRLDAGCGAMRAGYPIGRLPLPGSPPAGASLRPVSACPASAARPPLFPLTRRPASFFPPAQVAQKPHHRSQGFGAVADRHRAASHSRPVEALLGQCLSTHQPLPGLQRNLRLAVAVRGAAVRGAGGREPAPQRGQHAPHPALLHHPHTPGGWQPGRAGSQGLSCCCTRPCRSRSITEGKPSSTD